MKALLLIANKNDLTTLATNGRSAAVVSVIIFHVIAFSNINTKHSSYTYVRLWICEF